MRTLLASLLGFLMILPVAHADDIKPDDSVVISLAAEDWVTTKSARVIVGVEAAVTAQTAGNARADMQKAVNDIAKSDWRLTSFNRSQDQTGLERWSAQFEARLAEPQLGGLNDAAKKASKPGMQLTVYTIDFSPTLEERQAAQNALRTQIYKMANDQLTALNTALPGRNYRIAVIDFGNAGTPTAMFKNDEMLRGMAPGAAPMLAETSSGDAAMERAEKASISARVIFAALAPIVKP
jgi:hypothetical protein